MPGLASRQAGWTELCLSTGSARFDRRVWSSSDRDRGGIEDDDDKGETVRVGGRQTRSKGAWEGSLGTFPRVLPNRRPSAKAGPLKTQAQVQLQSQLAAHGRGSHGPQPRARSRQEEQLLPKSDVLYLPGYLVPTCPAKRLAIKQAQPASEGRAKGSRRGLDGALFAGIHHSVSSGVSRFVSLSSLFPLTIRNLKVSSCVSGCDQLTPSSLNSIMCESKFPSRWSP